MNDAPGPVFWSVVTLACLWLVFLFMRWHLAQPVWVDKFQTVLAEWQRVTFPGQTLEGTLNHLKVELDEIRDNPEDVTEFADAFNLLCQAASRAGHKMSDVQLAGVEKHIVNLNRDWGELNPEGFSEHTKH